MYKGMHLYHLVVNNNFLVLNGDGDTVFYTRLFEDDLLDINHVYIYWRILLVDIVDARLHGDANIGHLVVLKVA
jgi:hypothetical protein